MYIYNQLSLDMNGRYANHELLLLTVLFLLVGHNDTNSILNKPP